MQQVPLRNRAKEIIAYALVDDEDYQRVIEQGRWCLHKTGYVVHGDRDNRLVRLHRFIMGLTHADPQRVDHIDRNPLNNQRLNLRLATNAQNGQNLSSYRQSSSGYRGVSWDRANRKWKAHATLSGKFYSLGHFSNKVDAAQAAMAFRTANMPFSSDAAT